MRENELIENLLKHKNGGNYLLLFKIIKNHSKDNICEMSHEELSKIMNRNRRFIAKGLKVFEDLKLLKLNYKKIEIIGEIKNENL